MSHPSFSRHLQKLAALPLLNVLFLWGGSFAAAPQQLCTECQESVPQVGQSLLSAKTHAFRPVAVAEPATPVALPMDAQPVLSSEPMPNHLMVPGAPRYNCSTYADSDFQRARDSSRYPWHTGIFASNGGGARAATIYGTSYAQDVIFEHQHPASCEGKKFLQYAVHGFGPGSNIHTIGLALALAMNTNRILVLPPKVEEPHLAWYDEEWCAGARGWECWVLPVAGCLPKAGSDVARFSWSNLEEGNHNRDVPTVFEQLLLCSGVSPEKYFYWWRAQASAYLMRFNEKTRVTLDNMRQDFLFEAHEGQVQHSPDSGARGGGVAMLVRRGDKQTEMEVDTVEASVEAYVQAAQSLFIGNQQLPVLSGSSISFSYPSDAFAQRRVFVHSDDETVMQMFRSLAGEPGMYSDPTMQTGKPDWTVSFLDSACQGWCDPKDVVDKMGPKRGLLMYLLSVEESLMQDAFICPLQSGWCQLIDELRMTVAGKAAAPFIDMSAKNTKSKLCPVCYLSQ